MKKKFYAVARGRKPGIYKQWFGTGGAEEQIRNFSFARYKGFATLKEAENWLSDIISGKDTKRKPSPLKFSPTLRIAKSEMVSEETADYIVFTDGGCLNNPGPGGYGIVVVENEKRRELSGGFRHTTNNRMELTACIVGLRELKPKSKVILYSDSKYVVDGITKSWAKGWRSRNWKKSNGEKALNPDLWAQLLDLCEQHTINFRWVKGHAGNEGNERCDELATMEANRDDQPEDEGYPG